MLLSHPLPPLLFLYFYHPGKTRDIKNLSNFFSIFLPLDEAALYHQEALYQIFSITLKDDISFKMTYNANDYTLSSFYAPFGRPVPGPVCHYCAAKHSGAVFWEPLLCFGSQYKGKTVPRCALFNRYTGGAIYWLCRAAICNLH